jgi:subtilisin family serine protease
MFVRVQIKSGATLVLLCLWFCQVAFGGTISPALLEKSARLKSGEKVRVIVRFTGEPDLSRFARGRKSGPAMIHYLKTLSEARIAGLRGVLGGQQDDLRLTPLWISNGVALDVTEISLKTVVSLPSVLSIVEDEADATSGSQSNAAQAPGLHSGWNINIIHADSVWILYGIDGSGVLIGSMDTGFDPNHPSILSKWKGGGWFDAINGRLSPYDDLGHGTHTTGTLVGGDGPGIDTNDIGIAYGARFIAAKMLTGGYATIAQVVSAAQWMLDPDGDASTDDFPHVINNSWFSDTRGSTWFVDAAAAWRIAGIIPVFCAANYGPDTGSTRSPGDYSDCLSIGGTNAFDDRYQATSVGPSPAGPNFPDDRRKPDLSAPGEAVRSSVPGGGFALWSGTSMAAPHVTGTIALMLQANPDLTYDETIGILKQTAVDLGAPGYDFIFGNGRIDALHAVRAALDLRVQAVSLNGLTTHETGDSITLSIVLRVPPADIVAIHLLLSDTTEGRLLSSAEVDFTPGNWNVPQTIVIQGVRDDIADGDVSYTLSARTSSSDRLYAGLSPLLATIKNVDSPVLGVDEDTRPHRFSLSQNFPNPFNPKTDFRFRIGDFPLGSSTERWVKLAVYDLLGSEVALLVDEEKEPGDYSVSWDAGKMPSGVYYYRLTVTAGATTVFNSARMMILVK